MKARRSVERAKIRMPDPESWSLRQLVDNRWFALADLLLVSLSAAAWILIPQFGLVFSLIALVAWALRRLPEHFPFQRSPLDWLIVAFLVTAWIGYWAAYDKSAAWIKVWLIFSAVLLYYALRTQPAQNLVFLSFLSFSFALALSIYFCLTYDFAGSGRSIAIWWMNNRPQVAWPAVHPGYISGLILISIILASYWLWNAGRMSFGSATLLMPPFLLLGMSMFALVFVLTVPRGIELISLGALGFWILRITTTWSGSSPRVRAIFPAMVLIYLAVLITFVYLRPARDANGSADSAYGINSRSELLQRGAYVLADYPITGAGLAAFPGQYSQYILNIPHFYFINSYNLFLDVGIEQGVIGGSIFIILYLGGVLLVAQAIVNHPPDELSLMRWLGLLALIVTIVHGLFYDYLYNGNGTVLLFYPLGMALGGVQNPSTSVNQAAQPSRRIFRANRRLLILLSAIITVLALSINKIASLWFANLGAVQMSQVELKDFPTGQWATSEIVPRLERAEDTLNSALQYESSNETANYRLGLISTLRQDFRAAVSQFETAYQKAPKHRGLIKSLGYCYVWLGDIEKAQPFLDQIPEARNELRVYIWWWKIEGRPDLSERAAQMVFHLDSVPE